MIAPQPSPLSFSPLHGNTAMSIDYVVHLNAMNADTQLQYPARYERIKYGIIRYYRKRG